VLSFGPLVRQRAAERSPLVAERLPLLHEVLQHVAHPAIRSRGTIVGSIAHADPAAELPALFVLLEGEARVRSSQGRRTVPAAELFASHLETTCRPGEWIEEVRLPARQGGAFEEFARRHGDYALCGVAAIEDAFSFVGMGATPVRFVGDVREAVAQLEPEDDIHATAAYRRHLALRLAERVVSRA
jgi:carbon-monoxide dehydrogenase medium subunit